MKRSFLQHAWSLRLQFMRYATIGITSFVLDLGILYLFDAFTPLKHYAAVLVSQPFILLYVFYLNKHWSFSAKGLTHKQLLRFLAVSLLNYVIAGVWMWFFNQELGFQYLLVRTANVAVSVSWNFALYKYWVYQTADGGMVALENG